MKNKKIIAELNGIADEYDLIMKGLIYGSEQYCDAKSQKRAIEKAISKIEKKKKRDKKRKRKLTDLLNELEGAFSEYEETLEDDGPVRDAINKIWRLV